MKTMILFFEVSDFSEMPKVHGEYSKKHERLYGKAKAFRIILEDKPKKKRNMKK